MASIEFLESFVIENIARIRLSMLDVVSYLLGSMIFLSIFMDALTKS